MPTQGQRQDFLFPPTDNSSTTLTSYDQVSKKWIDAFESNKPRPAFTLTGNNGFYIITLLNMGIILIMLLVDTIIRLLQFLLKLGENKMSSVNSAPQKPDTLEFHEWIRQQREKDKLEID